jgi:hypothetical protein
VSVTPRERGVYAQDRARLGISTNTVLKVSRGPFGRRKRSNRRVKVIASIARNASGGLLATCGGTGG